MNACAKLWRWFYVGLLMPLGLAVGGTTEPLKVGDAAPRVSSTTDAGETLDLGKLYDQHPYTLVYFYPKADTPGCTKQGCSLRDAYAELTGKGLAIVGVSADTVEAQRAFKAKYQLPFTLLADREKKVIQAFRVPLIAVAGMAKRQAYLVKGGKIVWADYSAATDKQAADVLKILAQQP